MARKAPKTIQAKIEEINYRRLSGDLAHEPAAVLSSMGDGEQLHWEKFWDVFSIDYLDSHDKKAMVNSFEALLGMSIRAFLNYCLEGVANDED